MVGLQTAETDVPNDEFPDDGSPIDESNISQAEQEVLSNVSNTISVLEVALASWDIAKSKPKNLEPKFMAYRRLHDSLSALEKKILLARGHAEGFDQRVQLLREFVSLCQPMSNT